MHEYNPTALAAQRIKATGSVIVLFDGLRVPNFIKYGSTLVRCYLYRKQFDVCYACGRIGHRSDVCPTPDVVQCRGCGMQDPGEDHICSPKCKFCGEDHPTGDKACRQRYRIPYVVRVRRRERSKVDTERESAQPTKGTPPGAGKCTRSRSRSGSRHRSTSRGRNRSRSREGQLRFEEQELKTNKKKEPGVTWAEKVKGTVKATGNGAIASQVQSNDARVEQLIREVISLKKANEELKKQIQEMNKGLRVESSSAAIPKPLSRSNSQVEEGTPAPKKRAVVPEVESMCSVLEGIKNAIRDLKDTVDRVPRVQRRPFCHMIPAIQSL